MPTAAAAAPRIVKENGFWSIDSDNQVTFPLWEKITVSEFWLDYLQYKGKRELIDVGRGGGKTHMICLKKVINAFEAYWEVKNSGVRFTGPQWHLMMCFPAMENAETAIGILKEIIPQFPGYAPDGNLNYRTRDSDSTDWRLFGDNELLISVHSSYSSDYMRGKNADDLYVDEAFKVKKGDFERVLIPCVQRQGRPPQGSRITAAGTPDTEELLDPWFDDACDQADESMPEKAGFYSDFKLFAGDFTVNPFQTDELREQISKEQLNSKVQFKRERLGIRHLIASRENRGDGTVGNVWNYAMIEPCYYDQPIIPQRVLIAIDVSFGGSDSLAIAYYDEISKCLFDLEVYTAKELNEMGINTKNYEKGICALFEHAAARFPMAEIIYDANSDESKPLSMMLPRHLRLRPVKKNNHVKNGLVETLGQRLLQVKDGKNFSFKFPNPTASWLTEKQRGAFKRLVTEAVNYYCMPRVDKLGNVIGKLYTKITPYTDDCLDAVFLLMDGTPAATSKRGNFQRR